jgi:rifampicin phosphotransferase
MQPLGTGVLTDAAGLVRDVAAVTAADLPAVGGKAANLGVLTGAGFRVPAAFCLGTAAYRQVAEAHGIADLVEEIAAAGDDTDCAARAAKRLRTALSTVEISGALRDAVVAGYHGLGDGRPVPVAVRSSATAEDLPGASFAGQQDTYLQVIGADEVLAAVRRCWASLWNDRAVAYRTAAGIDHRGVALAVVVQVMVDPATAGVAFTANPLTGNRRQTVIEATPGLGEALVSGAVDPDRVVVDAATGTVLAATPGKKQVVMRPDTAGGVSRQDGTAAPDAMCLEDSQIEELAAQCRLVAQHYGVPQDIEWAIDHDGTLWLLQARPITTLYPLPPQPPEGDPPHVYFCYSAVWQGLRQPLTPLGMAGMRLYCAAVASMWGHRYADPRRGPAAFAEIGQRMYLDITAAVRSKAGAGLPAVLGMVDAPTGEIVKALRKDPRFALTRSRSRFGPRLLRLLFRYGVPLRIVEAVGSPPRAHRRLARCSARLRTRLRRLAPARPDAPLGERLRAAERMILECSAPLLARMIPPSVGGGIMFGLACRLLGGTATDDELQTVMRGLPHNVTTEMDLDLWRIAARVRADETAFRAVAGADLETLRAGWRAGTLPPVLTAGVAEFLDRYGHRAVAEIDLGVPRWAESPEYLFSILLGYLGLDDDSRAPEAVFVRATAEAETMVQTLVDRARTRGRVSAALVRFTLDRTRQLIGLREYTKYHTVLVLAHARGQLRAIGAELAARGALDAPDDVAFLGFDELAAAIDGADVRQVIARSRAEHEQELPRRRVPRVLLSDGSEPEVEVLSGGDVDGALTGTAASAGSAEGTVRVVLDPSGAALAPGEILVAPSTDPGWTPLFLTASAVVLEMGGVNSHGAVVAREYGIPAVVGVSRATELIASGQRVRVDGSAGRVTPL